MRQCRAKDKVDKTHWVWEGGGRGTEMSGLDKGAKSVVWEGPIWRYKEQWISVAMGQTGGSKKFWIGG